MVSIRDQPGALYRILEPLARRGISMNRIESRPDHGALWRYAFFIDVGGHAEESPLKDALAEIDDFAGDVRVLRSEEHTSELQSLMRISYAVFCLKNKKHSNTIRTTNQIV